MPARIHKLLPAITADINSMTRFTESMAAHFGKELTLCYIRKEPRLLNLDFDTVLNRCSSMRELLGIRDSDIPQMLRKCPRLLLADSQALKAAYDHIPRVIAFTPALVRALVTKYPPVLVMSPQRLAASVERLRQLCYTREEWARDFEGITPSLLAYFLRDATDQLMRLEYLASTGERPEWQLREVMKPAGRSFRSKLRNFGQWELRVKQRRAQAKAAAAAAQQQAAQQAEAAAIKAELLAVEEAGGGAGKQQQRQQQQQQ
ncbi:hypothetical protein OEZ85_010425 [Tetradesmus obliquus]|uniref:Uncharacterized protein n=1 Tax=Tetradesmus obliquus TaxID=3088 RepID=A0ABY8TPD7_TETOB|nr:hypothetical protein OEZ85_010425 [Tetradesmus obliquus]